MNKNIIKFTFCLLLGAVMSLTSCNKEPDESNLYTFTGQTIYDYLQANDDEFHNFNVILQRSGYDRMLDTYGQYTCYAPTNEGVLKYIDDLWNDETSTDENGNPYHNGLTENSLDGLTDEWCQNIAKYHISNIEYTCLDNFSSSSDTPITTVLNTTFLSTANTDGEIVFNDVAKITQADVELTNGYVQVLDQCIPLQTKTIYDVIKSHDEFSIFFSALQKTGLKDTLDVKERTSSEGYSTSDFNGRPGSSMASGKYFVPDECKVKFTIFAENDDVMKAEGITDFESLKARCIQEYQNAASWYENPDNAAISTGDDYTNPYNVVNMFVRYHILAAGMPVSKLLYDRQSNMSNENWNYAFGGEPYDYYETLLPHALMKIWQPLYHQTSGKNQYTMWINRYRVLNTLTDEIGLYGSESMHSGGFDGVEISRTSGESNITAQNGYIHSIKSMLWYNRDVNEKVLAERLRFDMSTILYETINNDLRFAQSSEIAARNQNGSDATMARIPLNYFQNMKVYNQNTKLAFYLMGAWRAWESDQISFWGDFDFAFRIPPVPSGTYELRIFYPPMDVGAFMQYYIGTSSDVSSMSPLGIPFNASYPTSDDDKATVGYLAAKEVSDYGVESDLIMRNHGYMRCPASFSRGTYNGQLQPATSPQELVDNPNYSCRFEDGNTMLRKIMGTVELKQGQEYWIRIKSMLSGYDNLGSSVDVIELVPISIINSQDYTEDWY